ncbi:hypothetical protein KKF38_02870 [Patescibacteria group bacterium]|nr:hypothetical protein [Patescibacteria group bacterium]
MQKFSKKILAEIKKQKIEPRSRLIFLARNYGVWLLAILGIALSGIFLGNLISDLLLAEWDIFPNFPGGRINFLANAISIFWLAGIIAAFVFAFFLLRKTKRGYRIGILTLASVILIASATGGISLLFTPLPPKFRELRMQHFPPRFDEREWQNSAEGFLFGEIVEVKEKMFLLNALDHSIWEVDISKAQIPPFLELKEKLKVRVIGEQIRDGEFRADFVKPENPREILQKIRGIPNERKFNLPAY